MEQFIYRCFLFFLTFSVVGCSNFLGKEKIEIEGVRIPVNTYEQELKVSESLDKIKITNYPSENKNWQYADTLKSDSNQKLPKNIKLKNRFKFSTKGLLPVISYPVVTKDALIYMDKSGIIYSYSVETGKLIWKNNEFLEKKIFHEYLNGGLSFDGNMLYATLGNNLVLCIDIKTGKLIWKSTLQNITRSAPFIIKDIVIVQTLNNGIYALSKISGDVIWSNLGISSNTSVLYSTSPISYKNFIIIQGVNGNIRYIDISNGFEIQSVKSSNNMVDIFFIDSGLNEDIRIYQPIIKDKIVYYYDEKGDFHALNLDTGINKWKKKFNISVPFTINDEIIYAVNKYGELLAIDSNNGMLYLKINLNDYINKKDKAKVFWGTPIIVNSNIQVINSIGHLLTFDVKTKKLLNILDVPKKSYIQPAIADEKMYITSSLGEIAQYSN